MSENLKCVVAAFIHQEGRVLVAKRARTKTIAPGQVHLPGGHVMFAEDARDALAREIKEEFSLEIDVGDPLDVFSYTSSDCSHTIGIVFFAQVRGDCLALTTDANDNEWVEWLPLEQAKGVLEPFGDHNFDALIRGFERLSCGCAKGRIVPVPVKD
jgi:8-oxo-dGTP pyrophosphatase MutT (NUDIX family)